MARAERSVEQRTNKPTYKVRARTPRNTVNPNAIFHITDATTLLGKSRDEANNSGVPSEIIRFSKDAGEAEVAEVIKNASSVLPIGAQSSLTAGVTTPEGSALLDMTSQDTIIKLTLTDSKKTVTVKPGISLHELQKELDANNLYFPPVPTFDGATVGGVIATNAAGAATFKYGQTRPWVEAITVVLGNGEVLDIKRGQYRAKAPKRRNQPSYFELIHTDNTTQKISAPSYKMPHVPKISAGYYGQDRGMDLIDLFIGSEGTLGVITEATLKVIEKPLTSWAMIPCDDEAQALDLTKRLREQSQKTWETGDQNGIDIAAIEYIDEPSVNLLREESIKRPEITPPKKAKTLLIVQLETPAAANDTPLERFTNELGDLADTTLFAYPQDQDKIKHFKYIREAVPSIVNGRNRDNGFVKVAADMIAPFDRLGDMLHLFERRFSEAGLHYAIWGHFSDGNVHPNVMPTSEADVNLGKQIIIDCGKEVIAMGGSPLAEHGVGKHEGKQELLELMYGKSGIDQMRALKRAFDPLWKLAPGNLFTFLPTGS